MEDSVYIQKAKAHLAEVKGRRLSVEERRAIALEVAALLLNESRRQMTHKEQLVQGELSRMMEDSKGKAFTTAMTDECFRTDKAARVADQLIFLLKEYGIPRYLGPSKRLPLLLFKWFGHLAPSLLVPLLKSVIRHETSRVILPGERRALGAHIKGRVKENVRVNLNHLGEAILGEEEAKKRLKLYVDDLLRPEIEYVSVKISTICSQLNLLSWEETLKVLSDRLRVLYRAALKTPYVDLHGKKRQKFVNLDMEEYRDLLLTCELFKRVLDEPEFFHASAGIVLQSYLPDSYLMQRDLTVWAEKRVANGGAPIKIRIVKGANLSMEKIEASLRGWSQAPYKTKAQVDANYKRMLHFGFEPEHAKAVHIGVGSHNLFDIAYALLLRAEMGVESQVSFEMLEGMADQMRRAVQELSGEMLLYCPAATKEEFVNAVAYLVRRLDENTAPENFLRHLFGMIPGTREWSEQASKFSLACHSASTVPFAPRRQQNRLLPFQSQGADRPFFNEPDTDFSLVQNRKWGEAIVQKWSNFETLPDVPLVIGGKVVEGAEKETGRDPSRPKKAFYTYNLASIEQVDAALKCAEIDREGWSKESAQSRSKILARVADDFREARGEMLGALVADGGKTVTEADVEYSEAIDFIDYYRKEAERLALFDDLSLKPKGIVVVTPPWNFPSSIPTGGIAAALAAGNRVIFKPAREVAFIGYKIAELFWKGGVSKEALQFVPCKGSTIGNELISDPRVSLVVLTGATDTAKTMLKGRADLDLMAETGGKNSIIVTSMCDRDLAVRDIVQSAFSHSGQKCSACSLAILVKEVYDDPKFLDHLKDAAASLKVGPAWNLSTKVNPLIHPPEKELLRGLTTLEEGESWLVEPKCDSENPHLWSPGIKLGVKEGSFTHKTELFGPVLGLMRAESLEDALRLANGTSYGLTAGLQSLDDREQEVWKEKIVAGNLYINRGITGAIVQRQPFGGCKESSFGTGAKAGGPNYVAQMMRIEQVSFPKERLQPQASLQVLTQGIAQKDRERWNASLESYAYWWKNYFSKEHDPSRLLGQDNLLKYVPHGHVWTRVTKLEELFDLYRMIAASSLTKTPFKVSASKELEQKLQEAPWLKLFDHLTLIFESEQQLMERIDEGQIRRFRTLSPLSESLLKKMSDRALNVHTAPVLANGRLELFHWVREVAMSIDYHRWGNLGLREEEERSAVE